MVEKIFLFLWVLLLPTQLGKHFWPSFSSVSGIRVDYLSVVVYLQDIVWGLWFLAGGYKYLFKLRKQWLWVLIAAVNVIVAVRWQVSLYKWIKVLMLFMVLMSLRDSKVRVWKFLRVCIPVWVMVEFFLGLAQFITGSSVGGVWYWLGERQFSYLSIGVAQWSLMSDTFVRIYGTFSHPNSLAGFMLLLWFMWLKFKNEKNTNFKSRAWWWWIAFLILGIIFLCGSRSIWLMWMVGVMVLAFRKIKNKGWWWIALGLLLGASLWLLPSFSGWDESGMVKRISLAVQAGEMIKQYPLLGVGLGNFIVKLPDYSQSLAYYWLQPVHNVFLLLTTELGLPVVIWLGWEGILLVRRKKFLSWESGLLGLVITTGMWDHYWLTLPQNMGLLAIILGLVL